ncbi:MAG: hypothetical protein WA896_06245, partial [Spirulinaceae cyanobacterium]
LEEMLEILLTASRKYLGRKIKVATKMYTDAELLNFILSNNKKHLEKSIGKRLLEIKRFFGMDISSFLKNYHPLTAEQFFSYNSGAVQVCFEDGLNHSLAVYSEQLSIILLPEELSSDGFTKCHPLSEEQFVSKEIKSCLNTICRDIRIWTLKEEFESEEAKEVAISYLLSNNHELFYCIYLHEDLDSDYLLLEKDVPRKKVNSCFSVAIGDYV